MTPDHWDRQVERWMDIFSDDEPDLMALDLVREFESLTKKFYSIYNDDDLNEWAESSEIYVGVRRRVVREEEDIVLDNSYPVARPNKNARKERSKLCQYMIRPLSPESREEDKTLPWM